jgi:PAS domain S-box-containing protein
LIEAANLRSIEARVVDEIKEIPKPDDTTVCPYSGLPVERRPEWTDVQLDENYWVTVEVIGGHILRSSPRGYATASGVAKVNALHRKVLEEAISPGTVHIHIANYTLFLGAGAEARRAFTDDIQRRDGLAALIFHNVSPLFKLAIKLGRRFTGVHIPIEITSDSRAAVRRALEILQEEGIEGLPLLGPGSKPPVQGETGALDLDGYHLRYTLVDGHIVLGRSTGFIGLREMERHIEFESMILSSLDPARGNPVMVADISALDGVSAAARRLYVAALRHRQRVNPIALLVCFGVDPVIRSAINISRPFLPFRIRIARDESTALEIARRTASAARGPAGRIRSLFFPDQGRETLATRVHIEDLLRLISNIDWESDGPVEAGWEHTPNHPLAPVIDAIELIKADVDELLRTRRKTETALRQSEERYRTILDTIVDGYYEINLRGEVMFCNDALLRIFGYARSEVDDLDALDLLAPENRERAVSVFTRVFETGEPAHSIDWEIATRDGSPILIETSISLITDVDGQAVGFRGIIRDITERVRAAQERANLEAQLQRSQRMEAIGTLAGGIAHNFNNLLMGIQGNISLLMREHSPDSPHAKRLATIEALVEGGSKLTSQLLGYARSGRVDVRVVDLNALVLEIAETFSLTRKEYRVHTELATSSMPVEVDPAQIEQAILNLLINAADAMPRGGDLYLSSRVVRHTDLADPEHEITEGNHAVLSIRDTGIGMDQETLDRCFEPFFTTKGLSGGTGLGLASAYGIVRANRGSIDVVSSVGEGTTFSLAFPISPHGPDAANEPRGEPIKGAGTILVIEDDEAVLEACSEMLTHLHYTPICVSSGEAAVDIFGRRRDDIDLVILDLILTDLNGGEVFDRLRAIDPDIRVLLASGYSLDGEAAGILERGCNGFIQKPFTIEQLSRKLDGILRRGS